MPEKRIHIEKRIVGGQGDGKKRVIVVKKKLDDGEDIDLKALGIDGLEDVHVEEIDLDSVDGGTWVDEEDENGHTILKIKIPKVSDDAGGSDPLVRAAGVSGAIENLEAEVGALVKRARSQGYSWTQIGNALSTTKQAAWERFSGEE